MSDDWSPRTRLVHGGTRRSQYGETSEAIFLTQGFVYPAAATAEARFIESGPDEFIYARYGNPTVRMFEERMAVLEGAEDAFATASGMAAVHGALFCQLKAGDHVVSARALFGSCLYIVETLLPRFGVEVSFVDGTDLDQWRAAIRPGTRLVFLEIDLEPDARGHRHRRRSPSSPTPSARRSSSTTSSPRRSSSAASTLGADVVIYSATKHIDGQGRCLGGIVLGTPRLHPRPVRDLPQAHRRRAQPVQRLGDAEGARDARPALPRPGRDAPQPSPRPCRGHPALARVIYPGLPDHPQAALAARQMETGGTMLSLELAGGKAAAFRFLDALEIVLISNNLGDTKSLVTHPATTTHQRLSAGAARRARHRRRTGAALGRPGGPGRPARRPPPRAGRAREEQINRFRSRRLHFRRFSRFGCLRFRQVAKSRGRAFQFGGAVPSWQTRGG